MKKIIGLAGVARSGKDTAASILLSLPDVAAFALADPLKLGCQALFGLTEDQTWNDFLKEKHIDLWQKSPRQLFQEVGTDWMRSYNPDFWLMRANRTINYKTQPQLDVYINNSDPKIEIKLACQAFFLFSNEQIMLPSATQSLDPYWDLTPAEAFDLIERFTLASFPAWRDQRSQAQSAKNQYRAGLEAAETLIIKDIRFENEADFIRNQKGQVWHIKRPERAAINPHSSEAGIQMHPSDKLIINDGSILDLKNKILHHWKDI